MLEHNFLGLIGKIAGEFINIKVKNIGFKSIKFIKEMC